jgi:hypothetical protein
LPVVRYEYCSTRIVCKESSGNTYGVLDTPINAVEHKILIIILKTETNRSIQTMWSRFALYSLLAASLGTARLQLDRRTEEISTTSSALFDLLCLNDGTACDVLTTCANCCAKESYMSIDTLETTCGAEPSTTCYVDGTSCANETHYDCYKCCNGSYADNGLTCGGQCLASGTPCESNFLSKNSTCHLCCNYTSYMKDDESFVCGCMEDGTPCEDEECYSCCNGAFDDNGKTCGGQCLESGTECTLRGNDRQCDLCCNYTYWYNQGTYECGCIEDGKSCIPGENCYYCCHGNYNDGGSTCGGQCLKDGMDCIYGEDCHTCCGSSSYWYSAEKWKCGIEPCYEDGESCIPGLTCKNCCSGGAYDGDGTICGGKCLPSGTECSYYGTCSKCCKDDGKQTDDDYFGWTRFDNGIYPVSDFPYHWDSVNGSMVCGYELCRKDGVDCIPGVDCGKCCNSTYYDSDGKCGGQCLKAGTKCNYYGTCMECCQGSSYDILLGHHVCSDYSRGSDFPSIVPSSVPSSITRFPTPASSFSEGPTSGGF